MNPDGRPGESECGATFDQVKVQAEALHRVGRDDEVRHLWLEFLALHPFHYAGLLEFAEHLRRTQFRMAARLIYQELASRFPQDALSRLQLAHMLREEEDWGEAAAHYKEALALNAELWPAHQGLSYALQELGDLGAAKHHRDIGFSQVPWYSEPYIGEGEPLRVLLLVSSSGGNTPTATFLHPGVFHVDVVVVEYWQPEAGLPPHQVIFNAVSDADLADQALRLVQQILNISGKPAINPPAAILGTGRLQVAERLQDVPGVRVPRMARVSCRDAQAPDGPKRIKRQGFDFPLLVRAVGHHTGRHFVRVADSDSFADAVRQMPAGDLFIIEALDIRHEGGKFRKFRMMIVDGELLPLHLAVSGQWKVHYFTAETENPAHQAAESLFLRRPQAFLGDSVMAALHAIQHELGLDYGGIDFDVSESGEVVLFEANATMTIPDPNQESGETLRAEILRQLQRKTQDLICGRG